MNYKPVTNRDQNVHMLLDAENAKIVFGSTGLATAAPPSTATPFMTTPTEGLLGYTTETQTITGTFAKVRRVKRLGAEGRV